MDDAFGTGHVIAFAAMALACAVAAGCPWCLVGNYIRKISSRSSASTRRIRLADVYAPPTSLGQIISLLWRRCEANTGQDVIVQDYG